MDLDYYPIILLFYYFFECCCCCFTAIFFSGHQNKWLNGWRRVQKCAKKKLVLPWVRNAQSTISLTTIPDHIHFISILEAIKEFDSGDIHEDANLKCYMLCIFEAMDIWGEDDRLHLMKLADHLDENYDEEIQDIAIRMGRKCVRVEGDNKCERAFWYHKCWKMQDPRVSSILGIFCCWFVLFLFHFHSISLQHYFLI